VCQGEHEREQKSLEDPDEESRQLKLGFANLAGPLPELVLGILKPCAL
jgi:hypothetical protein